MRFLRDRTLRCSILVVSAGVGRKSEVSSAVSWRHHQWWMTASPVPPQTNGKAERFWRKLNEDVIEGATDDHIAHFTNELLDSMVYYDNHRPNQALAGTTPKAKAVGINNKAGSANW